jgi:glycerophosphoryl diester phosphodiesterase
MGASDWGQPARPDLRTPGGSTYTRTSRAATLPKVVRRATLNMAHRGASGSFPENTLSAFRAAVDAGADMCELDAQATRDGAVVVIHDDMVDRTTDGRGYVAEMALAELKRLDAAARFKGGAASVERIPTLDEVFDAVGARCGLNVELKSDGIERKVISIIRAHEAIATAMVSSFEWEWLRTVRMFDPDVKLGLLAEENPAALVTSAAAMRAYAINPRFDMVNATLCEAAHGRGLKVLTWTVDSVEAMRALIGMGVDGIMTNYPERLAALLKG